MSVLEAYAAGLPVMASDLGAMTEIVGPLGPAWLVPPADPTAWAASLASLRSDDSLLDATGAAARRIWEARYSPSRALEYLLAAYAPVP